MHDLDAQRQGNPPPYDTPVDPDKPKAAPGKAERQYLYYQVYAPDGVIPAKTAYDPENPYIGRIPARSIPPPHIVESVQRCILKAEDFSDPQHTRTGIYFSVTSKFWEGANSPIAVVRPAPTHGATPENPLALVHRELLTPLEMKAIAAIDLTKRRETNPQYLYYRLFTPTGEDISAVPFDPSEPSIGRIEWKFLSPPRHGSSLKYHIAKIEGKPIYLACNLYKDIGAQAVIPDFQNLTLPPTEEFGTLDNPVVLVQRPAGRRTVEGTGFRHVNVFLCRTTNPQDKFYLGPEWLQLLDE